MFFITLSQRENLEGESQPPNDDVIRELSRSLRQALGVSLFGIDVIINNQTGQHAVIDVNAFPGRVTAWSWNLSHTLKFSFVSRCPCPLSLWKSSHYGKITVIYYNSCNPQICNVIFLEPDCISFRFSVKLKPWMNNCLNVLLQGTRASLSFSTTSWTTSPASSRPTTQTSPLPVSRP